MNKSRLAPEVLLPPFAQRDLCTRPVAVVLLPVLEVQEWNQIWLSMRQALRQPYEFLSGIPRRGKP